MKEKFYKHLSLSLLVTTAWTAVAFFIFYYEEPGLFYGLSTLMYYLFSSWTVSGVGLVLLLIHFIKPRLMVKAKPFLFTLASVLNSYSSLLFIILAVQKLIDSKSLFDSYFAVNFVVAVLSAFVLSNILKDTNSPTKGKEEQLTLNTLPS